MQSNYTQTATHFQKRRRWNRTWKKVTMILASVVVFVTTYALILPAITMEPEYICGKDAHVHTEACYQLAEPTHVSNLICTFDTLRIHKHTTECFHENSEPICGNADFVLHTHSGHCYDRNGELVCVLPELKGHIHDELCWEQFHVHADTCYIQQRGELLCAVEEGSEHAHLDTCYTAQQNLMCTVAECAAHTHTIETCYEESKALLCTEPEVEPHSHSDSCYTVEHTMTCTLEELEGHAHSDTCYGEDGSFICALPEIAGHKHGDACYQTTSIFSCTLQEIAGHIHTDACYSAPTSNLTCTTEETEGHTHGTECFETVRVVACAFEENVPHTHTDACFICTPVLQCEEITAEAGAVPALVCQQDELFPHEHTESCFDEAGACTCGLLEIAEHDHDDACFVVAIKPASELVLACGYEEHEHTEECVAKEEPSDETVFDSLTEEGFYCGIVEHVHQNDVCDNENGVLICTMAEHEHVELCLLDPEKCDEADPEHDWEEWLLTMPEPTGNIAADLIAVAELQIGYAPSDSYYTVTERGDVRFYNRYSAWWGDGNPYGDWNAKFVAFCLNYAGITDVPLVSKTTDWPDALIDYGQWRENDGEFQPIPADLVFFDDEEDGIADRVGMITAVNTADNEMTVILEIEGLVQEVPSYKLTNDAILGYARIPGNALDNADAVPEHVQHVINLIGQLPTTDEVNALAETYNTTKSDDDLAVYAVVISRVEEVMQVYNSLSVEEQIMVTNAVKLIELDGILDREITRELHCWLAEYTHDASCLDEKGLIVCDRTEHSHIDMCYDPVQYLVVMIDTMPTGEEAEAKLLTYEETEDWEGFAAYQQEVAKLAWPLYYAYEDLAEEAKAQITNYDHLMETSWLWSQVTLEEAVSTADISKVTYNPEYETDDYHTKWETPGTWITEAKSLDSRIHINEIVPDAYTIDGLVLGAKSADSVQASFTPLYTSEPTDTDAEATTGFTWSTLVGTGMDCTLGANLILPSDKTSKDALLGTEDNRPISVLYKNIGTYNGHVIDLRISLVDYENYVDWYTTNASKKIKEGVLGFWTKDIRPEQPTYNQRLPGISVCGVSWVQVLYEFLDTETGVEVDVKGSTSFYDLDFAQAIHIRAGDTKLKGIYVTDVNDSVPDLDTVNGYTTRDDQRGYFESWTADDCILMFSDTPPKTEKDNVMTGVVVYSPHGNDSGSNSEQYGDTKHAFTMTFERNNINIVYSFDKGKNALNSAGNPTRNANGGIIHSAVPVYTGSLEIQKEVTGAAVNSDKEFRFQIEFYKDKDGTIVDPSLTGTFGNVTLNEGVGTFTLKGGESIKISGIPIRQNGTPYEVTELNYDGYVVKTSMTEQPNDSDLISDGPHLQAYYTSSLQPDDMMEQHQIVVFENYGGYVLPETGGIGTAFWYYAGGGTLLLSMLWRKKQRYRGRRVKGG